MTPSVNCNASLSYMFVGVLWRSVRGSPREPQPDEFRHKTDDLKATEVLSWKRQSPLVSTDMNKHGLSSYIHIIYVYVY